jgi:hypothetical protein
MAATPRDGEAQMSDEFVNAHFPSSDYYVQSISPAGHLDAKFLALVQQLAPEDDLAAHLAATPDYVVMHRRLAPSVGAVYVRLFDSVVELTDRERHVYEIWYPLEQFLLMRSSDGAHCWLSDFLNGSAPKVGPIGLQ